MTILHCHSGDKEFWRLPISGNYNPVKLASSLGLTLDELKVLEQLGEINLGKKITPNKVVALKRKKDELYRYLGKSHQETVLKTSHLTRAENITFHLGPTNSGKTFNALKFLVEQGEGVYAAPLRMLAFEAYEKLTKLKGANKVGLLTGEERINPTAPIICATVELAPSKAKVMVLDEAQWIKDPQRGWAWANLMLGEYQHLHVCSALEAEEILTSIVGEHPKFKTRRYKRLADITHGGVLGLEEVPERSVVVAFSRKKVLELASQLVKQGKKVSVLYGALPPQVRRVELEKFNSGEHQVMVATDVIGHGINMPVDNVILAETSKFDGVSVRELETWELAQIAGRAGRYLLSDKGRVFALRSEGFRSDPKQVKLAVLAASGKVKAKKISQAKIAPRWEELNSVSFSELLNSLQEWEITQKARLNGTSLSPVSVQGVMHRLRIASHPELSVHQTWLLAHAPLSAISLERVMKILNQEPVGQIFTGECEKDLLVVEDLLKITRIAPSLSPWQKQELESLQSNLVAQISSELNMNKERSKNGRNPA